jgi:putative hemolysin
MDILVLLFLFVLNGFFSLSEMAVVASRKARLQELAEDGRGGAATALELAREPSGFLSTIQIGITAIGITSGAIGEAQFSARVADWLAGWTLLAPRADALAPVLVIAGITTGFLLIGELVPKRLALLNPEMIASSISRPMKALLAVGYPLVRALSLATNGILRLLRVSAVPPPPVTEEEIRLLMEQGAEAGVFEAHEHRLVSRVFRLDELRVTAVMTPRTEIVYLDLDEGAEALLERITANPHMRFPVVRGDLDSIEGVVELKALLPDLLRRAALDLAARVTRPLYIPETLTVAEVLAAFKKHRQTLAFIVNEYGELEGLVTLSDAMQALVGDIAAVDEEAADDIVRRDENSWLVDGGVNIDRFREVLEIEDELPHEGTGTYNTLGGFAMLQLGRIPQVADTFEWGGWRFEVVDMDRNRVDRLLVTQRTAPARASTRGA